MAFGPDIVGRIYEAAILPDRWPVVLQDIADAVGAVGTVLNFMGEDVRFVSSPGIAPVVEEYVSGGWTGNEARLERMYLEQYPGFMAETAHRTVAELDALPIFRDFLLPRGLNGACATPIQGVGDTAMHVAVEGFRSHAAAEQAVALLDPLRPHLARALSLTAQIEMQRHHMIVQGLQIAGVGAAVISREGYLRSANDRFAERLGNQIWDGPSKLRFANAFLQKQFLAALEALRHRMTGVQSVAVRGFENSPAFAVHILPIVGAARDICSADGLLMLIAESGNRTVPNADLLRILFDLTPAEAGIARSLLNGETVAQSATSLGITENTVRVHLRSIFSKTGVSRQSELITLLSGVGHPNT